MESLLPLSRRVVAHTIAQDLVSIKPMSNPSNIDEYLRLKKIKERKKKIDQLIERMKKGE